MQLHNVNEKVGSSHDHICTGEVSSVSMSAEVDKDKIRATAASIHPLNTWHSCRFLQFLHCTAFLAISDDIFREQQPIGQTTDPQMMLFGRVQLHSKWQGSAAPMMTTEPLSLIRPTSNKDHPRLGCGLS